MKILLDECIDRRFGRLLEGHEVITVPKPGWAGVKNGELMRLASLEFDVFVTVDRNLSYQQNTGSFEIATVVIRSVSNRFADLAPCASALLDQMPNFRPGTVFVIGPDLT